MIGNPKGWPMTYSQTDSANWPKVQVVNQKAISRRAVFNAAWLALVEFQGDELVKYNESPLNTVETDEVCELIEGFGERIEAVFQALKDVMEAKNG